MRYARPGFQRTSEVVTSNISFLNIRLSSVQGFVTSMNIIIRDLATLGTATFLAPQAIDLLDEKGASVCGQPLPYDLLVATECRDQGVYTDDYDMAEVVPVPIGGEGAEHSGAITGYLPMSGNHQLAIKFNITGNMQVTVIYRTVSHVRIEQSHVTVHSS